MAKKKQVLKAIIERTDTGWSAYIKVGTDMVATTGKTVTSTLRNLASAYDILQR